LAQSEDTDAVKVHDWDRMVNECSALQQENAIRL